MKLKKVLRICLIVLYWVSFTVLLMLQLRYETAPVLLRLAISLSIANAVLYIIKYVVERRKTEKRLFNYKTVFQVLQYSHSERYKAYLNSDEEKIKEYEEIIELCITVLLQTGPTIRDDKYATDEQRKEIQEMMSKTKELNKTIVPPYNPKRGDFS